MKGFAVIAVVAVLALVATGCGSGRYATHASGMADDSLAVLTKQDVIAMTKARVGANVILGMINRSGSVFSMNTQDVIALSDSGVADTVIHAMVQTGTSSSKKVLAAAPGFYSPDYYWWWGDPSYDPWFWSGYYGWAGPYYGVQVHPGFYWRARHR